MIKNFYLHCSEIPKYYRFEGKNSFSHFDFSNRNFLDGTDHYIYFSKTEKHHFFYVARRLRQLIEKDILSSTPYSFKKSMIVDKESFQKMIQLIECAPIDERQISIEFTVSPLFSKLLSHNATSIGEKHSGEQYVERVDVRKFGGGYGICGEWLELFHFFTYFYAYQKINRMDLIHFLYAYRNNMIHQSFKASTVPFLLDIERRTIEENSGVSSFFRKYELMDLLERILEKKLYLPNSFLGEHQMDGVKQIILEYLKEKEEWEQIREYSSYKKL